MYYGVEDTKTLAFHHFLSQKSASISNILSVQ